MEFWTNEEGSTYAVLDLDVLERCAFTKAAERDPHGIGRRLPFFEGVSHLWQCWVVDFGDITLLVPPSVISRFPNHGRRRLTTEEMDVLSVDVEGVVFCWQWYKRIHTEACQRVWEFVTGLTV